ncbi:GNAT family N-acetyltransferase [Fulvivirga sedimenti]|uniref:GNAT family N-acetyltransferase n=1 Tax=Fulvivirga sedimenti TaxID=2879465 RepID=A0A9X1KY37_9BACT|nr:GNAT family N-acetyltransferase [Fulvivirga sedimenti]MCA6075263.1 GNAT family N-acetyltransferase [Fulvivirga sedimenti]MCA6076440.1 GNAT family N-acetyltransferase [Fulvivirga sedimenti]MCA6077568.1 GNAT family N-acetyltransferase [Fulvivirga sedimenti]
MNRIPVEIRLVQTNEELKQAFAVREAVYIVEQNIDREDEFDEFEPVCRHFVALQDGEAVGAARWRFTNEGIKLERFAVLADFRKRGIASQLVDEVIRDIKRHPKFNHQTLYLNAQWDVQPLYAQFGFKPVGDIFLECDIKHQRMEMSVPIV